MRWREFVEAAGSQTRMLYSCPNVVTDHRVVRVDILERLADLIRPAIAYRPGVTAGEPRGQRRQGAGDAKATRQGRTRRNRVGMYENNDSRQEQCLR